MDELHRRPLDLEAGDGHYPSNDAFCPWRWMVIIWRWMKAPLVLNASRRFRYTPDLNKEEQAAQLFHAQGQQAKGISKTPIPSGDFCISQEQLATITTDRDVSDLADYGGVKGLADLLKTDLDEGIHGDDADLLARKNTYGSNTYPRKKGRSFWMFLWEAWQDLTLIILIIAAVVSLVLGIKTKGIKEGWYDGGSIAFAVILIIVVTAISDYRHSPQFQNFNEEKRNIPSKVVRGGRIVEVPIDDIVVGDVVHLNNGDQVPADGVLIPGHSLAIDESSMTGESKIVHNDARNPFLMSGCKFADGDGTMLVTSVGINTKLGLLMAFTLEDSGEETLQAWLNGIATRIVVVGLTVAAALLVVLLARFFTGHMKNPDGTVQFKAGKTSVGDAVDGAIKIITVAVTIVVVAVPGGLALAVRLIMNRFGYSMRKMMVDKALVRRLSACETLGSVTTICCDKTGTLTLNQDPCCPGVKDAVRLCQDAGIKVRMVSGDDVETARAIALDCGILNPASDVTASNPIEGKDFCSSTDEQRKELAEKILVMARSSPNDKLLLVQELRKRGDVVAVTGDGTNDAPALHEADVVLSVGIQGTEVVKESPDIIILDDDFATVVKVVRWGRYLHANIEKLIQFQLIIIAVALIINVAAAVSSSDVPLNVVQLLWVNLVMTALGLALATEPPTDDLINRSPVGRRERLFTKSLCFKIVKRVVYQLVVLLIIKYRGLKMLGLEHDTSDRANEVQDTVIFNAFVFCQILNAFYAGESDKFNVFKRIMKNRLFMGMVILTLILQVIIIEFLGKFTSTVRLTQRQWLVSVIIPLSSELLDALQIVLGC